MKNYNTLGFLVSHWRFSPLPVIPHPLRCSYLKAYRMRLRIAVLVSLFIIGSARAQEVPAGAPVYDLRMRIDAQTHIVTANQIITWTNKADRPTRELIFNFYPSYKIPEKEYLLLAKTLELLRLNPSYGIDPAGGHGSITDIRIADPGQPGVKRRLKYSFRDDNMCAMVVELPEEVPPGQTVTVEIDCEIRLPNKQGRWGHWDGVTYLTHSLPTVAYHDNAGWHAMPFVPWHQPFWNEAGLYRAEIAITSEEEVACSAVPDSIIKGNGETRIKYKPFLGRDFAVIASAKFRTFTKQTLLPDGKEVSIRCLAFPQHEWFANEMLTIAEEAIQQYSKWFGSYPYSQFTIAESYFGWNGNECAGLVMIDERVFDMPKAGRNYVEYLLSHETCHQWWYNKVGTNGYAETFMDEGPATYFTHRYLDRKRGKKNTIIEWPDNPVLSPHVRRDVYRYSSMYSAIRKNEMPAAAGQLPEFGNLFNLFTGAYDRGSKIFGMIEERMGEAAFLDFMRDIQKKFSFQVLSAAQFRTELEAYTGKSWGKFFDDWVYSNGTTDWSIETVKIERQVGPRVKGENGGYRVQVLVKQRGEYDEPTQLGFRFDGQKGWPIRVPIGPTDQTVRVPEYDALIEPAGKGFSRVTLTLPDRPTNVIVDPDDVVLDADPGNNAWYREPKFRFMPLYSMVTDADLTNDYDRWNFKAGPWVWGQSYQDPWYTRSTMLGLRAGAVKPHEFLGGIYTAFRSDYRDLVVGADALFLNTPFPKTQIGLNYERRIGGPYFGTDGSDGVNRASLFFRYILQETSSMYLSPMSYIEGYTNYQDNFLPFVRESDPAGVRYKNLWLTGVHYRLNLYTPYWDAERGIWIDVSYAAGTANVNGSTTAQQVKAELAGVKKLPDGYGWFSDIRLAGRGTFASSWPSQGEFFALGGGMLFRGFDLAQRQGSMLWVVNAEARLPLFLDKHWNFFDNTAGIRNVWLATFTDIGAVYTEGRVVNNTAVALGLGLRVDTAIFSFIERATFRADVAKTINDNTGFQFWLGLQHPF